MLAIYGSNEKLLKVLNPQVVKGAVCKNFSLLLLLLLLLLIIIINNNDDNWKKSKFRPHVKDVLCCKDICLS